MAFALAVTACAPHPAPPDTGPTPDRTAGRETVGTPVVTLERTACFGRCPVYRLSISAGGIVRYEGKANVEHLGSAEETIPAARVDSLVEELRQRGYFGLAEAYVLDSPACGRYSTDSPSVITSVAAGGDHKQIRHDYGCSDAPPELARLEARIDEVAGASRWTRP
jgi:hypothetical protein